MELAKVLVTGSRGVLGRRLIGELKQRGHQVTGLDLHHEAFPQHEYLRADIGSFRQLEKVFETDYDYVYHLAAEFGRKNGEEYYEQLWQTNAVGTRNILEWQVRRGFRVIMMSSSEIYGDLGETVLNEALTDHVPVFPPNDYAISKWVNELQAINFIKMHGSEIVRLRLFNTYGPGEYYHPYRSVICLFCHHALTGQRINVFRNYFRTFMYLDDLFPTMANVIDNFKPGEVYNVGGKDFRSVEEVADLVFAATGADPGLADYFDLDYSNSPCKRPDITRAVEDLGHNPITRLEEGIPHTIVWMRKKLPEQISDQV